MLRRDSPIVHLPSQALLQVLLQVDSCNQRGREEILSLSAVAGEEGTLLGSPGPPRPLSWR